MTSVADKLGFGPKREVRHIPLPEGRYRYEIDVTPPAFMGKDLPTLTVKLTEKQYLGYLGWQNGQLIQDALPDLSPTTREVLMTGLGDDDFHNMCMDKEEDGDGEFED